MARRAKTTTAGRNGTEAPPDQTAKPRGRRGRPPAPEPDDTGAYTEEMYEAHLLRMDESLSEINTAQANRRELLKGEAARGIDPIADKFVRSLRAKVQGGHMTERRAQMAVNAVVDYFNFTGLPLALAAEQRERQQELDTDPAI
jgi:hypothetical protein